jgi:hypothetical protein
MVEKTKGSSSDLAVDDFAKGAMLLVFIALFGSIIEILVANFLR